MEDHRQQTETEEHEQIEPFDQQDQGQLMAADRTALIKLDDLSPSLSGRQVTLNTVPSTCKFLAL